MGMSGRNPVRTCIGCRTSRPKHELLRLVAEAPQELPDRAGAEVQGTGDGRGVVAAARPAQDEAAVSGRKALSTEKDDHPHLVKDR